MKSSLADKVLALFLLVSLVAVSYAVFFAPHQDTAVFGSYNPSGGGTYRLQSSISSSQTTITLSSFKEPVSNIPYTMSYLNSSIEYGTLEPGNNSGKEFISFTGITQNADGTATLTGVSRGLSFSYPYTASTTLQQTHSGQSIFILSNPPQLTNQYANKNNTETISGVWTFATGYTPKITDAPSAGTDAVNKTYADGLVIAGAPIATYVVPGIGILASQSNAASSTASTTYSGNAYANFLHAALATDTPNTATRASRLLMSDLTGYLKQSWLDLTALWSFSNLQSASTTLTGNLAINGSLITFPSTQGASSTVISAAGSGVTTWEYPMATALGVSSNEVTTTSNSSTTLATIFIPARLLGGDSQITVDTVVGERAYSGGHCIFALAVGSGVATTSMAYTAGGMVSSSGLEMWSGLLVSTSTTAEFSFMNEYGPESGYSQGYSAYTNTSNMYIDIIGRLQAGGTGTCVLSSYNIVLNHR